MSPIIPVINPECQLSSWKNLLKTAISDPIELLKQLGLTNHPIADKISKNSEFRTRVPQPFIDKMKYGDPNDPLLLQVLPLLKESEEAEGYSFDPLVENQSQSPGILHKYHGRLLVLLASTCAVNCRYCFRRHFPYEENAAIGENYQKAVNYIRKDSTISEVILSGGDPLIVSDYSLEQLVIQLESIEHVKRLRIHSRLPVVIPQRITDQLCQTLANSKLHSTLVLHINHANEIDALLVAHLAKLKQAGVTLLNQSVLLKGVNADVDTICELSESLFDAGVLPYYLHLMDKVQGAAHFDTQEREATTILENARARLPGYLTPRLAREIAGENAKTIVA